MNMKITENGSTLWGHFKRLQTLYREDFDFELKNLDVDNVQFVVAMIQFKTKVPAVHE